MREARSYLNSDLSTWTSVVLEFSYKALGSQVRKSRSLSFSFSLPRNFSQFLSRYVYRVILRRKVPPSLFYNQFQFAACFSLWNPMVTFSLHSEKSTKWDLTICPRPNSLFLSSSFYFEKNSLHFESNHVSTS